MPDEKRAHPIIYVRGFAATHSEIEDTVADPYMGFNIGSTKVRISTEGKPKRFYFESPLVRLMSEQGYDDVFIEGQDSLASGSAKKVPYKCIVIHRYYDEASEDFGSGKTPQLTHFARRLSELILNLRKKVCANEDNAVTENDFRVYLVAHSMGGLICRAFLQNTTLGDPEARAAVDKLFTYATPHNGIDMRIVRNVPGWATFGDVNNFNRTNMASFFGLPKGTQDVSIVQNFPPERIFNLVGTNPGDYNVAGGLSSWAVGNASDGLVRIENATTHGSAPDKIQSPSAFVHRSHSGHFGIVNSEEGYQNLTRFLFGTLRVDGILDIEDLSLPAEVFDQLKAGHRVEAAYQFEISVSVRGCQWYMTRRDARENSAIICTYDELFPGKPGTKRDPDLTKSPKLFTVFLDPQKSLNSTTQSVAFAFDLKIRVPDYEVAGALFLKHHFEGSSIFEQKILVEATPDNPKDPKEWKIKYALYANSPQDPDKTADLEQTGFGRQFQIPLENPNRPGFKGNLRIEARNWR